MKIEHTAWQVEDPVAAAEWYVEHLGMKIVRQVDHGARARFIADDSGTVMIEIYRNEAAPLPDYRSMDPLVLHLAFVSDDVAADRDRLLAAGASIATDLTETPSGDRLVMLRDPWGFPVQLCQRSEAMV